MILRPEDCETTVFNVGSSWCPVITGVRIKHIPSGRLDRRLVERHGRKYVKLVVTGRYELYGPKELFNLIKKHPDQKFQITHRVFVNPQNLSETVVEEFCDRLWNLQM